MTLHETLTTLAALTACGLSLAAYLNVRQNARTNRCTGKCRTNTGSRCEALEMHPDHWKNKIPQTPRRK